MRTRHGKLLPTPENIRTSPGDRHTGGVARHVRGSSNAIEAAPKLEIERRPVRPTQ